MPDFFYIFAIRTGVLGQLARAFAWHARCHRLDLKIVHVGNNGLVFFSHTGLFENKIFILGCRKIAALTISEIKNNDLLNFEATR